MRYTFAIAGTLFALLTMIVAGTLLGKWEREHGYPFGQMCNSVFTGYANTCPAK